MNLNQKILFNALAEILFQNEKAVAKLERGFLAYTPALAKDEVHRLNYSKKGVFPTKKDGEDILNFLKLHLRAKTRLLGHIVVSDINEQRHKQIGIHGCTVFTWMTRGSGGLLKLNKEEALYANSWFKGSTNPQK